MPSNTATQLKIFFLATLTCCLVGWFQNCSAPSIGTGTLTASSTGLYLGANAYSVAPNGQLQFNAGGGAPPYLFSTPSTLAYIDSQSGVMTAGSTSGTLVIQVTDQAGGQAQRTITIADALSTVPTGLTLSYSPTDVTTGTTVTLTGMNGSGNYTYSLVSGGGELNDDIFTAPSYASSSVLQVTDDAGAVAQATINVVVAGTAPGSTVLTAVAITPNCPGGTTSIGGIVDGSTNLCAQFSPKSANVHAISGLNISAPGAHTPNASCSSGVLVGSFSDCSGGSCYGVQSVCATFVYGYASAIKNLTVTALGLHAASGPGCSAGYAIGSDIDCGNGSCSGYQQFCATY